ncbi:aspartyl-tRNA(Asn)/glutamyl-tRNA(Gln) amidotransferase subunit A [Thalassovita litoralis]|uniref:Aspartyl-tRNA(Asn)/glutamyl-tRNA(Gln) amidotransferase subunit A n=1 Tax=Thalassovita litoralis TaxID=1010611 RepID=A0A521AI00_9RHOB|nr:amidase family protein [Thalassovita litoralis]SMO34442.1 aspartyl-tRNA(Asn)/glutamyl-tRNA(Gln) amidotransferase subunit A [Thalassovita litoralis]
MQDWLWKSAGDLGRGIGEGAIDPVALTETYLEAIDANPFRDRIYARVTADRARAEAKAAAERAKAGHRLSLLDGVPISWKDLFDSAGVATEAGSALLKDRVPDRDAWVLRNATAQGLVCLGKTHMSELAFSGLGLNPVTATPPCVNDHDAVPGGSSSGAAASVAFGLAACGIGSDTGGSVRIPSAWNDLVGLKTTSGRIPLDGVVPLCLKFDTIGPLCRTVEDAALMLGVLEGGTAADLRGATLKGRRFAALQTVVMDHLRPEPLAAYLSALDKLRDAGAVIEDIDAPEVARAMDLAGPLYPTEAYGLWRDVIEANPHLMFDRILDRFRGGAKFSAPDYVQAWQELEECRAEWNARVARFDAVLCPTSPILPPNADRLMNDDDYYVSENLLALQNTRVGNLMGGCGIAMPTGTPSCGITFNGLPMQEERLLRIAAAAETALRAG